ncbi:MAG: hypothetical protein HOK67_26620 [Deltaproteobacteria bacterium]|jgi:hypothetical protein|nr:hypothetical protein [Deltaproteobacteria bacterium]MBT4265706.1 hypothetical protein [Deltaproteobacteria bacterium]MBT6503472.1 hypothetical protein [Deltaproteobacteria bacterium]MBT6611754.1 hypothetical protein [Deltaproteobacteria bacterium]
MLRPISLIYFGQHSHVSVIDGYLSEYDTFAVVKCSCRNMAELAGEPCQKLLKTPVSVPILALKQP